MNNSIRDRLYSAQAKQTSLRDRLYASQGGESYESVLSRVQEEILEKIKNDVDNLTELEYLGIIEKHLTDKKINCNITNSTAELANYIYHDMAKFSFISREKIFEMDGFEELNINAWNDVDIIIKGKSYKTAYSFLNPEHAIDVHKKMLRVTGTILDDAMPKAIADIGDSIRVSVVKTPIVDKEAAIQSSIRKVALENLTKEVLIAGHSLTNEMHDFLLLVLSCGVSICVSGDTGAGKSSLAGHLTYEVAETKRTITIEQGSREWDFVRRDKNGKPTNSVLHWKTRSSEEKKLNISQEDLVELVLRFNADVTGVGEMRGKEAFAVLEAANTGNTIISTIHSNGTKSTPRRIITLAKKAYAFDDDTLFQMAAEAFPILVHTELLPDATRRVTEIVEVKGYKNQQLIFNTLYSFYMKDNVTNEKGEKEVIGNFVRENDISKSLAQKMLKKGASRAQLKPFAGCSDF